MLDIPVRGSSCHALEQTDVGGLSFIHFLPSLALLFTLRTILARTLRLAIGGVAGRNERIYFAPFVLEGGSLFTAL